MSGIQHSSDLRPFSIFIFLHANNPVKLVFGVNLYSTWQKWNQQPLDTPRFIPHLQLGVRNKFIFLISQVFSTCRILCCASSYSSSVLTLQSHFYVQKSRQEAMKTELFCDLGILWASTKGKAETCLVWDVLIMRHKNNRFGVDAQKILLSPAASSPLAGGTHRCPAKERTPS